ncbi:MAG TPA: cytochrome P450 [Jiangellaceae bacterium]|nr:cytochrome P450 [Jiangellaceae bacterium]
MSGHDTVPRTARVDSSLDLLREGYTFVSARCDALGSDLFSTRLMGRRVTCMRGAAAAELFYGREGLVRNGAIPSNTAHLLQDEASVQTLEGEAHQHRKRLFLGMLGADAIGSFTKQIDAAWDELSARRRPGSRVHLYDEMNHVLTLAALRWCGLADEARALHRRTRELQSMIEYAGSFGPGNWRARLRRRGTERWARSVLESVRRRSSATSTDQHVAPDILNDPDIPNDMVQLIASHEEHGQPLPLDVAAVELLNVLRPIVAISRFVVFAAVALQEHPQWKRTFASGDMSRLVAFTHEVRRYYPFFPMVPARTTQDVEFAGHLLPTGSWLLLDLYGTNHDDRLWDAPQSFAPERFDDWAGDPYTLVPQGGGAYSTSHRCPGERFTVAAIAHMVRLLSRLDPDVPAQDMTYGLSTMPALPRSGFIFVTPKPR